MSTHATTHIEALEESRQAQWLVALAGVMVACGGFLLGVQVDAQGSSSGTGLASIGLGALVALVGWLTRMAKGFAWPRDLIGHFGALANFLGLSFLVGAVLAPGGPWMFAELVILLLLFARAPANQARRWVAPSLLWTLALMLLFRLWVTYQGSVHQWQVLSVPIPVLAWIPLDFLEPVQSVALGSFTPSELGFPPLGLDFKYTVALWSTGFALCAGGLFLLQLALREHENDRIHERIHTLPRPLAQLVERILPEEQWEELGLHGLADRMLTKRIETLVRERVSQQRAIQSAYQELETLTLTNPGGFQGAVQEALQALERRNP